MDTKKMEYNKVYLYFKNILDKKGYFCLDKELFNKNYPKTNLSYKNEDLEEIVSNLNSKKYSATDCIKCIKPLFKNYKCTKKNIIFDESRIILTKIASVPEYLKILRGTDSKSKNIGNYSKDENPDKKLFTENVYFRGQSSINYLCETGVYRNNGEFVNSERKLFKEMLVTNPNDFKNCNYTIEKMAKMQHYGLPTRLLDLTKNPLIALYFACENTKKDGEIIFFKSSDENECYFDSEEVSIIANLFQIDGINETDISLLSQFVKSEIGYSTREIKKEDLEKCFFVKTNYENQRIRNQQGSFLLCGIEDSENSKKKQANLDFYQLRNKKNKKIVFYISHDDKKKILDDLARINITKEFIYPEIDDVASFLKEKYKENKHQ